MWIKHLVSDHQPNAHKDITVINCIPIRFSNAKSPHNSGLLFDLNFYFFDAKWLTKRSLSSGITMSTKVSPVSAK